MTTLRTWQACSGKVETYDFIATSETPQKNTFRYIAANRYYKGFVYVSTLNKLRFLQASLQTVLMNFCIFVRPTLTQIKLSHTHTEE